MQLLFSFSVHVFLLLLPQSPPSEVPVFAKIPPGIVGASYFSLMTLYYVSVFSEFFQRGSKSSFSHIHGTLIITIVDLTYKIPIDSLLKFNSISHWKCLLMPSFYLLKTIQAIILLRNVVVSTVSPYLKSHPYQR